MSSKTFSASFKGICGICGRGINKGSRVKYDDNNKIVHATCEEQVISSGTQSDSTFVGNDSTTVGPAVVRPIQISSDPIGSNSSLLNIPQERCFIIPAKRDTKVKPNSNGSFGINPKTIHSNKDSFPEEIQLRLLEYIMAAYPVLEGRLYLDPDNGVEIDHVLQDYGLGISVVWGQDVIVRTPSRDLRTQFGRKA